MCRFLLDTGCSHATDFRLEETFPELIGSFNLIFYNSAEDAVFKALRVE